MAVDAAVPLVRVGLAVEEMDVAVDRRVKEACRRLDLLLEGEARRERVLRKADLRLGGGGGSAETSIGRLGSLAPGLESRSFPCISTISRAIRVRVRLWVEAAG